MEWWSSVSISQNLDENIQHCVAETQSRLEKTPDLSLLFVSKHFARDYERAAREICEKLSCKVLIGCSAGGVIGAGKEVEGMPGLSLTSALLPGVAIRSFHWEQEEMPSLDGSPRPWEDLFGVTAKEEPQFVILGDPFTFAPEEWLNGLDFAYPQASKVGGLASGASRPGGNALFLNTETYRSGLIGVALSGNIVLDTAVAQGCYPIGPTLAVSDCEENLLKKLDGRPALEVLSEILSDLTPEEQELIQHSLFVGIVMDSMKKSYSRGDFLIRNLLGADSDEGHLLVAARLHQGQTIQFHLRDAKASSSDLDTVLSAFTKDHEGDAYEGALLFSCLGRGQHLYGCSNHDSERFEHFMGTLPLGGFFCNGEIGPVDGMTYVHGYTSSFGLFRPRGEGRP
jgi:small ligand-binding sensory domain FIST